jgi:hypothetical protein
MTRAKAPYRPWAARAGRQAPPMTATTPIEAPRRGRPTMFPHPTKRLITITDEAWALAGAHAQRLGVSRSNAIEAAVRAYRPRKGGR